MIIDRSKFIVRSSGYPQDVSYPEICAAITENLIQTSKMSLEVAFQHVRRQFVAYKSIKAAGNETLDANDSFSKLRTADTANLILNQHTKIAHKYFPYASKVLDLYQDQLGSRDNPEGSGEVQITYPLKGRNLVLGTIRRTQSADVPGQLALELNAKPGSSDYKALWHIAEQSYSNAQDSDCSIEVRKTAALETYYLLNFLMPMKRGTSSVARILMEYAGYSMGWDIPHTRSMVNLSMEALIRPFEDFRAAAKNNLFFDLEANPWEVLEWQNAEFKNPAIPFNSFNSFHQFVVEEISGFYNQFDTVMKCRVNRFTENAGSQKPFLILVKTSNEETAIHFQNFVPETQLYEWSEIGNIYGDLNNYQIFTRERAMLYSGQAVLTSYGLQSASLISPCHQLVGPHIVISNQSLNKISF